MATRPLKHSVLIAQYQKWIAEDNQDALVEHADQIEAVKECCRRGETKKYRGWRGIFDKPYLDAQASAFGNDLTAMFSFNDGRMDADAPTHWIPFMGTTQEAMRKLFPPSNSFHVVQPGIVVVESEPIDIYTTQDLEETLGTFEKVGAILLPGISRGKNGYHSFMLEHDPAHERVRYGLNSSRSLHTQYLNTSVAALVQR